MGTPDKPNNVDPPGKGWFTIPGVQQGDRRVKEQLRGLHGLLPLVKGRTVLDAGGAEGMISRWLVTAGGAKSADVVEVVESRCLLGAEQCAGLPIQFYVQDCVQFVTDAERVFLAYDVTLALSIVHKLPEPAYFLHLLTLITRETIALRLPAPIINDRRSKHVPCDVPTTMATFGFIPAAVTSGPRGEWVGIFTRGTR